MLCQLCGAANPDSLETCRSCGRKLLVVSGIIDPDADSDDDLFEAQEQLDEHLLERITALEEATRKIGAAVASIGERLGQLEHNLAIAHAGVENISNLLDEEGIASRTEIVDGWERSANRELVASDLARRLRLREARILSRARHDGRANEAFARALAALEPALVDRDLDALNSILADLGEMAPDNDELWSLIGEAAFSTGEAEIAEAAFERVIELRGPHFETLVHLGNAAAELGHWERARRALEDARSLVPESFLPDFALGGIELRRGNHRRAIRHLEASNAREEVAQAYYLLGRGRLELSETGRAISALERAVELDPAFEEAIDLLGTAYLRRGWTRLALDAFRRLERLDPQRLRYREAVRLLADRPIRHLPRGAARLLERAEGELSGGHAEAALELYEAAGREAPGEPALTATAALLASTMGRTRRAVALARRALDGTTAPAPVAAAATTALLESLRAAGRPRAARRVADAIYRDGADDFSRGIAAYELALVESELGGDLGRARAFAREALERTPRELRGFPLAALAAIAFRRGRPGEAHGYLERAAAFGGALGGTGLAAAPVVAGGDRTTDGPLPGAAPTGIDHELLSHVRRLSSLARALERD
ncbi:MAG: tetratricopeptide repeat protein [Thermoanaerobaculales bacterium]|nr:tetratricopeptide repeat protein [Thermoanaerobaculales bacterium]